MAAFPLEGGEIFADRYRIIRCVASGGMGAVYEAVHAVTERRCALKVMLGHTVQREKLRERFMLESKVAAQIGSEYIVDILDAGVDEKTKSPFLVMELLEGEDLAQRLVRLGRFSPTETVNYLWHAALALDRTHQAGIVHRDLKASNLFLTHRENGTPLVKVLDFGVAKVMPLESGAEGRTQTVGTPIYMAPEQFRAGGRVSPATDIYALGMLAFTMLVGSHYWAREHQDCENPFAFASIAVKGPKDPPSVRAEAEGVTLTEQFDEWFARATSRVPGERFASATEAVEELVEALGATMPERSNAAHTMPTPPSGAMLSLPAASMPETVESRSGLISGEGLPFASTASISGGAGVRTSPSGGEVSVTPSPERTEVSLSVTSGGLDEDEHERARPQRRSKLRVVAVTGGVAAVVVGLFFVRRGPDPAITVPAATDDTASVASAEVTAARTVEPPVDPAAVEPPGAVKTETEDDPTRELPITTLDELPRASDKGATRRVSRASRPGHTPSPPPPTSDPEPEPAEAAPAPKPVKPAPEIARDLPGTKPPTTVEDRASLYGRD